MFWWLSFLRPPPVAAAGSVDFIPQITNDLRTELYPLEIDLYFTWASSPTSDPRTFTEPVKLTTWRTQDAHRLLVSAPIPPVRLQAVSSLSLGIFACPSGKRPDSSAMLIPLIDKSTLCGILPVFSAPVSLLVPATLNQPTKGKQKNTSANKTRPSNVKKQDEIQRVYLFASPPSSSGPSGLISNVKGHLQRSIIITEKTSYDLDKKVWDSGLSCSSWLVRQAIRRSTVMSPIKKDEEEMKQVTDLTLGRLFTPGCQIIELGAGSGVTSIVLSTLLQDIHASEAQDSIDGPSNEPVTRVHITDLFTAIPLINRNVEMNSLLPPMENADPTQAQGTETSQQAITCGTLLPIATVLDWEDDTLPEEVMKQPCDIILMSDVTYNTSSFPALLKTLKNLLALSPDAHVILAYKERHSAEREAWGLFDREAGLKFALVEEFEGAGGNPTEIWLGQVKRDQTGEETLLLSSYAS